MKKILIGTALAGAIVGAFTSLSFAAPLPARLDHGNAAIVNVAEGCGPYAHRIHFRDRFGRWVAGRCVRDREFHRDYRDRYYR
jgi:hypothetical protein